MHEDDSNNTKLVRSILGQRVRALRKQAGLTQERLAEYCGLFRPYLSRIESGTANPSLQVLTTLATALHVTVYALLAAGNGHSPNETDT